MAQLHREIQIFFPEFYACFIQSQLEKNRKEGSNLSKRKDVLPYFSQSTSSLFFQFSPEKHSFLSSSKLSHLIHLFWPARYVRTAGFIILQRTLNHGTEDTEDSCFSMSASGENVLDFWYSSMLLTDVTQELWVIHPEQKLSWALLWPQTPWG